MKLVEFAKIKFMILLIRGKLKFSSVVSLFTKKLNSCIKLIMEIFRCRKSSFIFPQKSSSISSIPIKNISANENVFFCWLFGSENVNRRHRKAKRSRELKKCLTLSCLRNRSIIFRDELRTESGKEEIKNSVIFKHFQSDLMKSEENKLKIVQSW